MLDVSRRAEIETCILATRRRSCPGMWHVPERQIVARAQRDVDAQRSGMHVRHQRSDGYSELVNAERVLVVVRDEETLTFAIDA